MRHHGIGDTGAVIPSVIPRVRGARARTARVLPALAAGLLLGGCAEGGSGAADPPAPVAAAGAESSWSAWESYGPDPRQHLRLLPGEAGRGVAVLVHGGSWRSGDIDTWTHPEAPLHALTQALHEDGWWVAAVEYRFATEHPWPATADDVHDATRRAVELARADGAGESLLLAGDSAGGHLAALEGVTHPRQVDAVVAYYGLHDFTTAATQRAAAGCPELAVGAPDVFGSEPDGPEELAAAREASPVHRVGPDSPPMMLLHGTADCVVPAAQSSQLQGALRGAGVPVELVLLDDQGHGGPAFVEPGGTLRSTMDFIEEHADSGRGAR